MMDKIIQARKNSSETMKNAIRTIRFFCNIGIIKRVTDKPLGENGKSRKTGENGRGGHLAG